MAEAKSIGSQIREGAVFAIISIVALGGVALAVTLFHYIAYQINKTSQINILQFFAPISETWNSVASMYVLGAMMTVVLPVVTWLVIKFQALPGSRAR